MPSYDEKSAADAEPANYCKYITVMNVVVKTNKYRMINIINFTHNKHTPLYLCR